MITAWLCVALSASGGWNDVQANGFVFEMPTVPEQKNGPVTWPTTGKMIQTEWTSKVKTGDKQIDVVGCYESTVPSLRMVALMHENFCKEEVPGQLRWDRTDAVTQARQCLRVSAGPDGKRRTLVKILEVGANVCVLSSSALIDKVTDEASPSMRRFVESLKATGTPTVVSVTPWVVISGNGFTFQLPEKTEAQIKDEAEPGAGKYKISKWKLRVGEEDFNISCMAGSTALSAKAAQQALSMCDPAKAKVVRTKLPNGATECSVSGPKTILLRVFPLAGQTCMVSATRETGESTQYARRFVESFAANGPSMKTR